MFYAEFPGDGFGNEAIGGGDDQQCVAPAAVVLDQRHRFRQHDGRDHLLHEFLMERLQFLRLKAAQGRQRKRQIGVYVQAAVLVVAVEAVVLAAVFDRVHPLSLNQEFAP
jgi:hypothetical protein